LSPTGLDHHSVLNQAIGVLRDRGHTLDDARDELHRLARDAHTTMYDAAQRLILAIDQRPVTEHRQSDSM
jgi:hypothetical protein